jgi:hypothetical protein
VARSCKSLLEKLRSDKSLWSKQVSLHVPLRGPASELENQMNIASGINRRNGAWFRRREWRHRLVSVPNIDFQTLNPHVQRQRIESLGPDLYCLRGWRDVQIVDASKASADGSCEALHAWMVPGNRTRAWGTCIDVTSYLGVERGEDHVSSSLCVRRLAVSVL